MCASQQNERVFGVEEKEETRRGTGGEEEAASGLEMALKQCSVEPLGAVTFEHRTVCALLAAITQKCHDRGCDESRKDQYEAGLARPLTAHASHG